MQRRPDDPGASRLAVTLTVEDLRALLRTEVEAAVGAALAKQQATTDVLTREQVAQLLHVDVHTVTKYVRCEELPGRTIGGRWRFRRADVLQWMEGR